MELAGAVGSIKKKHQIKHTINIGSQRSLEAMCLFVPWPKEQVAAHSGMFTPGAQTFSFLGGCVELPCPEAPLCTLGMLCIF